MDVTNIINGLLANSHLSNITQTKSSAQSSTASTTSGTDTVSLTGSIEDVERQSLLNAEYSLMGKTNQGATGTSLYDVLLGGSSTSSSDWVTGLLAGAENAHLMEANPTLVKDMLSAAGKAQGQATATGGGTSETTGSAQSQGIDAQALQSLESLNLLSVSPATLLSLLQKNGESQQTTTGSQISTTV
jgi:hypothetical protein